MRTFTVASITSDDIDRGSCSDLVFVNRVSALVVVHMPLAREARSGM